MASSLEKLEFLVQPIIHVLGGEATFIVLFGSAAEGRLTAGSDVDIAYLPREIPDRATKAMDHLDRVGELGDALGRRVDLIDLSRSDPIINWQVIKSGLVIWGGESRAWAEFRLRVPSQYEDFKRERSAAEARLTRSGLTGGPP